MTPFVITWSIYYRDVNLLKLNETTPQFVYSFNIVSHHFCFLVPRFPSCTTPQIELIRLSSFKRVPFTVYPTMDYLSILNRYILSPVLQPVTVSYIVNSSKHSDFLVPSPSVNFVRVTWTLHVVSVSFTVIALLLPFSHNSLFHLPTSLWSSSNTNHST